MTQTLPDPSELGAVALATLRDTLIPALPPELRYTAAMVSRALGYALKHPEGLGPDLEDTARRLETDVRETSQPEQLRAELNAYLAELRAKV